MTDSALAGLVESPFPLVLCVRFRDRPKVEAILDRAATKNYGVKSLIQLIIESELFRNK